MIIGCDIDNVLNTLCEAVLSVYNEDSGDNLTPADIHSYYIDEYVKPEFKDSFKNYFVDKRVWKRIKIIPDCQKYLAKIVADGHRVIFVTATEPENLAKKARWLQRTFPFVNIRKNLISCHDKHLLGGLDILIDDKLDNVLKCDYIGILYDYPWNQCSEEDEAHIARCKNWEDIYRMIKALTFALEDDH